MRRLRCLPDATVAGTQGPGACAAVCGARVKVPAGCHYTSGGIGQSQSGAASVDFTGPVPSFGARCRIAWRSLGRVAHSLYCDAICDQCAQHAACAAHLCHAARWHASSSGRSCRPCVPDARSRPQDARTDRDAEGHQQFGCAACVCGCGCRVGRAHADRVAACALTRAAAAEFPSRLGLV